MVSNTERYEEEQLNFPQADFPFSVLVAEKDEDEAQYGWRYEDLEPRQPLMFPPRLRLQSRPILHGQEDAEQDELASSSMKAFLMTEEHKIACQTSQRQPQEEPERKSVLARVVRWFVSPFAPSSPHERQVEEQGWQAYREQQDERGKISTCMPRTTSPQEPERGSPKIVKHVPVQEEADKKDNRRKEVEIPQTMLPVDFPGQEAVGLSRMGRRKNRLAGRTTKIRLETVSRPALQVVPKTDEQGSIEGKEHQAGERMDFLDAEDWTSMRLPAYRKYAHLDGMTSDRLSAVDIYEGHASASMRNTLAGHGRLESGQSDVTIANEHITAASIVVVTLTSNPGPVVVHYVSLLPATGFTVHLTAPATVSTTFNYVILLGELF